MRAQSITSSVATRFLVAACISLACVGSLRAEPKPLYKDARAPIDQRVQDLLSRMTLEEKAAQLRSMWFEKAQILDDNEAFSANKARQAIPHGIGQIGRPYDSAGTRRFATDRYRSIESAVDFVNAAQRFHVEQTRLGIPALFHEETAHGFEARGSTIFPIPPALASTWDPELVEQVYAVAAREARLRGGVVGLSPVLDLIRDPRYGRVEEFFSEDPYLAGQMGIASVRGQQGRSRPIGKDKLFATLKHVVHGTPQGGLNVAPFDVSERALRESYLVPFAAVIKEANPAVIMPSYNEVGGVPSHANVDLLQRIGRDVLGFRGVYFSDYSGISNLVEHHRMAADLQEAAVLAINAGVDTDLPEGAAYAKLPELVRSGRVAQSKVDAAVARVLALKFEAGLFEQPYVDRRRAVRETNTQADIQLARKAAVKALTLLKNDGVLPLDHTASLKIAVIGPNASEPLFGGYSGENEKAVSILAGLRAAAPSNISIEHADGVWITRPDARGARLPLQPLLKVAPADNAKRISDAVQVAQRADVVLLVVGDNPQITREAIHSGLPGDRNSLELYGQQNELVDAVLATGKPVITLLINGRPLSVTQLAARTNALLEGWYLGQEGGNAFADVLFGKENPGGKLPVSIARSVGELPAYYNRHPSADVNVYVEGKRTPLFPFGFGLSYTTFELSEPRLSKSEIRIGETVTVAVDVTNTGKIAGDEVVQLYVRDEVSSAPRPVLELKAFRRVTLQPGERRTVTFGLSPDSLSFWNIDMKWVVEPGVFTISAGNSSRALKASKLTVM